MKILKPLNLMENQFSKPNQSHKWEGTLKRSSFLRLSSLASLPLVNLSLKAWIARVKRGTVATLLARVTNSRNYAGLMAVALAPISESLFRFFDSESGAKTDYWNAYLFLHAIGPHLSCILIVTGFFILMPSQNKLRFIAILPVTYKIAKITWLASVNDNIGYHA